MKIKDIIRISVTAIMISILTAVLTGCTGQNATDMLAELCSLYPEMPQVSIYFDGAPDDSENRLLPEYAQILYGREMPHDLMYASALSDSTQLFEIHIIKPTGSADADAVMHMLENRLGTIRRGELSEFSPIQYYTTVEQAEILHSHGCLILTVTHDNSRIKQYLGIK